MLWPPGGVIAADVYLGQVLTPPDGLPEDVLVSALARSWEVAVASMTYRAVGFGSHHWQVIDTAGTRWFCTADELQNKRHSLGEPLTAAFGRLRASLAAASDLRDCGAAFVVAPVSAADGEPLARANDRFGVALYPFVDGQSFEWGEFLTPAHRRGLLDLIIAHTAPAAASRRAMADDFSVPHRDELEAALDPAGDVPDCGPFAGPVAVLLAENAAPVRRLLAHYDALVAQSRARPSARVLTHGEPHPGNTMLASGGWLLIDWDTALVAPPERDLWSLDPGDGTVLEAYADATGVTPQPSTLELYRIKWDLADVAIDVSRFRRQHPGSPEDDQSWHLLRTLIERIRG
jgi:spectinomycin phosphotransferase/16S rRNA (guanine(1405)-N(7))-methyltransferase